MWSLDSNWNWQSSSGWWGLNSSEAFTQETDFQQDFNGDGIMNKIEPPAPVDKDLYELEGEEAASIPQVPGSLDQVLNNLEKDHEFLTRGGVFAKDLIDTWIDFKRKQEVDYVRLRPHPAEFELYYDI